MARLPQPGKDSGTWGDILNDYLSTSHTSDGSLKDNTVGTSQLKDNSVGASQLQDNAVTASAIADGAITSSQLHTDITSSLAGKQDKSTLEADVASKLGTGGALDEVLSLAYGSYESVMKHGAVADGVTNDLAAFIEATEAGPTFMPAGIYFVDGVLSLASDLVGAGMDKTILIVGPNGDIGADADNIIISGFTIQSQVVGPLHLSGSDINNRRSGVELSRVRVTFDASVTANWLVAWSNFTVGLRVVDCSFVKGGLQLVEAQDFTISRNHFDGLWLNDNEAIHASTNSRGIIAGNTFVNLNLEAIDLFTNGDRCVIANNRIEGYRISAIDVKVVIRDAPYTGGASNQTGYAENSLITGNSFYNCVPQVNGEYCAVRCSWIDERAVKTLDVNKASEGILISNNVVADMFTTNPLGLTVVYCWGIIVAGSGISVTGNTIRGVRGQGLNLWDSGGISLGSRQAGSMYAYGCTITGNIVEVEGTGIAVFDARNCTIANNVIKKDERANLSPRYGLRVVFNLSNSTITGNVFIATPTTGIGIVNVSGSTFTYTSVTNNQFANGGVYLSNSPDHSIFSGNCVTAGSITLGGTASIPSVQNTVSGNKFLTTTDAYPIVLDYQKGFMVTNNSFDTSKWPILVQNVSTHGIIAGNSSLNQVGTAVVRYLTMTDADKATIVDSENIYYTNAGTGYRLTGSVTWDPASLADGEGVSSTGITVTGAALGDFAIVAAPYDLQGVICNAYVSAANTVVIRLQNDTGGVIDFGPGTWKVKVTKT